MTEQNQTEETGTTRRDFCSLLLKGAGALAGATVFGGLEALVGSSQAEARKRRYVNVRLDYQIILGNEPRQDYLRALTAVSRRMSQVANYYAGRSSLAIPEQAAISYIKPKSLELIINSGKTRNRKYRRVVSRSWDKRRRRRVVLSEFNLPKYIMRKNRTLKDLAATITKNYKTKEEKAQALLCFVQTAIKYDHQKVKACQRSQRYDFVRNPLRTLLDKKGDCKDTSILYANLLMNIGLKPIFLIYKNHVNVGVPLDFTDSHLKSRITYAPRNLYADGVIKYWNKDYYFAETTPESAMYLGKVMIAHQGKKVQRVLPVR